MSNQGAPTTWYAALCTNATPPTVDTNTLGQLTEIAAGNGYTSGGIAIERSSTGWPTFTEDDSGDLAKAIAKQLVYTASGGNLPSSGSGARWAVLTDDNATVANRQVIAAWQLAGDRIVTAGNAITVSNSEIRATE